MAQARQHPPDPPYPATQPRPERPPSPYVPPVASIRPTEAELAARAADVRLALTSAERETSDRLRSLLLLRSNVQTLIEHLTEFVLERARGVQSESGAVNVAQLIEQGRAAAHPHDVQVFSRLQQLLLTIEALPIGTPAEVERARQIRSVLTSTLPAEEAKGGSLIPTLWERLDAPDED